MKSARVYGRTRSAVRAKRRRSVFSFSTWGARHIRPKSRRNKKLSPLTTNDVEKNGDASVNNGSMVVAAVKEVPSFAPRSRGASIVAGTSSPADYVNLKIIAQVIFSCHVFVRLETVEIYANCESRSQFFASIFSSC